ncbi:hypothetical protein N2152v2_000187 [Parachlorella kessleri]
MANTQTTGLPTSVPAPLAHVALTLVALLPLVVPVPANLNVIVTACLTVFNGCWRSVKPTPPAEAMSKKDAMKFPIVGSAVLFSLFLAFKFLPKELVNAVLSAYFGFLGMLAMTATLDPLLAPRLPAQLSSRHIDIVVPKLPAVLKEGLDISFTYLEGLIGLAASAFCTWYYTRKHWMANNVLGLAFSLQGIEHLSLGAVLNGVILLSGLFFYDIFWVFCTPVMVSVAKSFDAPIKLLFPRGLDKAGLPQFSMLGLGDIVIPGVFVAIILRYDAEQGYKTKYFYSAFGGYVAGLATTIVVMNVFNAAQPALLYIVPAVVGAVLAHAAARGELSQVLHWKEKHEEEHAQAQEGPRTDVVGEEKEQAASSAVAKKDE